MKKLAVTALAFALAIPLTFNMAFAGNGAPSGEHWNINIIGHPKDYKGSGDDSSGHSIMIPLRNVASRGELVCNVDGVVVVDDIAPTWTDVAPTGARIYFVPGDHFEIIDRDATDSNGAKVMVPVDPATDDILFDIYIRVLGKPNTCMNIKAYAYDDAQGLWFLAGTVYVSRKTGKSVFVKANDLFDVWWCQVDKITNTCIETPEEISVFSDVFDSYFWSILNDGTRLVQVRIYPR